MSRAMPFAPLSLFLLLSLLPSSALAASCQPSLTTICVSHDGNEYVLEGGVSANAQITSPTPRPPLAVFEGTKYTFELTENGDFAAHPFALMSDATGACGQTCGLPGVGLVEGGDTNAPGGLIIASAAGSTIEYTAQNPSDIGNVIWYECINHPNMGNNITVVNATEYILAGASNSSDSSASSSTGLEQSVSSSTGVSSAQSSTATTMISSTASNVGTVASSTASGNNDGGVITPTTISSSTGSSGSSSNNGPKTRDPNAAATAKLHWLAAGALTLAVSASSLLL